MATLAVRLESPPRLLNRTVCSAMRSIRPIPGPPSPGVARRSFVNSALSTLRRPERPTLARNFASSSLQHDDKLPLNPFSRFNQRRKENKAAIDIYMECTRQVEKRELFVEDMGLPNTFETWYLLMVLHVWMVSARSRSGSSALRRISEDVSSTLCTDLEKRLYEGGVTNFRVISRTLKDLLDSYYGQLLAYDEGLSEGEAVMVAALWRNLFSVADDVSAEQLTKALRYVHKNLQTLDTMDDEVFKTGEWEFVA